MSAITRFLGDTPLRVALKLIVVSFLVGLVMSAFGWSPLDLLDGIREFITGIWNMGFRAIERLFAYFLLGAGGSRAGVHRAASPQLPQLITNPRPPL